MGKAAYRLIGVYKIIPTEESIKEAARYHECDYLFDGEGNFTDEIDWENHQNLALLEFQVSGSFTPNDLMNISQGDQAPYMEFYLDPRGEKCVDENQAIRRDGRRVCFFMHFLDNTRPVMVDDQKGSLTPMQDLPERLIPFTHYLPVD
ncbi:MAG: hypothetical protein JW704_01925 [Anaerolineaceae bacterium]|nr:hypothetical protein [Anaerolineaceae bacterium]MBN2677156.1 hypothetical protein [Anaerolineaceae bacterium]